MPTIGYFSNNCPDTEFMPEILVEITDAEYQMRINAPIIRKEETGRIARAEIRMYDETISEIIHEHIAQKMRRVRKPDNRSREQRLNDWDAEKKRRKDAYYHYKERQSGRDAGCSFGNHWASNAERKICNREKTARKDYEIELFNIEDDEQMKADARDYEIEDDEQMKADVEKLTNKKYWEMVDEDFAEEEVAVFHEWLAERERLNVPPDKWIVSVPEENLLGK